jgi:hypothetical protein
MSDASNIAKSLRERLSENTEERLGRALSDLLENPLITGAIGRAFDAREKASQAQEVAMGALNIPSAADIERLTRRLRAVSHRLEGIEDGVHRLDRALAPSAVEARLSAIEQQLGKLTSRFRPQDPRPAEAAAAVNARTARSSAATPKAAKAKAAKAKPVKAKAKPTKAKAAGKGKAASRAKAPSRTKADGKATAAKARPAKAKPARSATKPTRSKAKPSKG